MKKFIKSNLKVFIAIIVTAVICIGGTVLASVQFQATEIGYKNTTVDRALDDLYEKANQDRIYCVLMEGTGKTVGAKYYCDPGDGTYRYFYVLKVNTNDVELIMDRNISDTVGTNKTMTWNDAMEFFTTGAGKNLSWTNAISVDLPGAQEIADAGGIPNWDVTMASYVDGWSFFGVNSTSDKSKRINYTWLYDYTRGCISDGNCSNEYPDTNNYPYGYWTKDLVANDNNYAWHIYRLGTLGAYAVDINNNSTTYGVRPVIKMSKSNLSS